MVSRRGIFFGIITSCSLPISIQWMHQRHSSTKSSNVRSLHLLLPLRIQPRSLRTTRCTSSSSQGSSRQGSSRVNKTWPVLKTFVHGTYARKFNASNICNTMGPQGYVPQNMYHILDGGNNTSNTNMTVTQLAAAGTTGSTLGNTYQATAIPPELMAAINMIVVSQQSLYQHIAPLLQQMAALSFHAQPPMQARQPALHAPPIQHLAIPSPPAYRGNHGGYQQGYQKGRGDGRSTGCRCNGCNNNRRGHGRTPFADHMAAQSRGYGGGTGAFLPTGGITQRPFQSNLVKQHYNLNVCYLSWDPTINISAALLDNNNVTVATSNCSNGLHGSTPPLLPSVLAQSIPLPAHSIFGQPSHKYLNTITIATTYAITNTGAMSIFIMDGVDVVNKQVSPKPLTINMPDDRKIKSTHICDITIPGFPKI
jgi:hypothetical protein